MRGFRLLSILPVIVALPVTGSAMAFAAKHHEELHIGCAKGRSLRVSIEGPRARVQLADSELLLTSKPSSLGRHFRDGSATLIIDGAFVAFARKNDWDWQDCHVETPTDRNP